MESHVVLDRQSFAIVEYLLRAKVHIGVLGAEGDPIGDGVLEACADRPAGACLLLIEDGRPANGQRLLGLAEGKAAVAVDERAVPGVPSRARTVPRYLTSISPLKISVPSTEAVTEAP